MPYWKEGFMSLFKKVVAAVVGVAAASTLAFATAGPAAAINPPSPFDCAWNSSTFGSGDYFWFRQFYPNEYGGSWTQFCYVNSGADWNVNLSNVQGYHAGNNAGLFTYTQFGQNQHIQLFEKWTAITYPYTTIQMLNIY